MDDTQLAESGPHDQPVLLATGIWVPVRVEASDASWMSAQVASASLVDWIDDNTNGSRRGNPKGPALEANLTVG